MLELLLIRHGQTDWNVAEQVMGRGPIPLNETGRHQARLIADFLRPDPLHAVYASPMRRTMETAQHIVAHRAELTVQEHHGLAEIDYGEWVNLFFHDLERDFPQHLECYRTEPELFSAPGGETMEEALQRVAHAVDDIRSRHAEGRVALVSHADVLKLAMLHLLKLPLRSIRNFSIGNGSMSLLRCVPGREPRLIQYNPWGQFPCEH